MPGFIYSNFSFWATIPQWTWATATNFTTIPCFPWLSACALNWVLRHPNTTSPRKLVPRHPRASSQQLNEWASYPSNIPTFQTNQIPAIQNYLQTIQVLTWHMDASSKVPNVHEIDRSDHKPRHQRTDVSCDLAIFSPFLQSNFDENDVGTKPLYRMPSEDHDETHHYYEKTSWHWLVVVVVAIGTGAPPRNSSKGNLS